LGGGQDCEIDEQNSVNQWEMVGWSNLSAQASNGMNKVIEEHMHLPNTHQAHT